MSNTAVESDTVEILFFSQPGCALCPSVLEVVREICEEMNYPLRELNLAEIDDELEFELLENQVFVSSVPTVILRKPSSFKLVSTGAPVSIEDLRCAILRGVI